MGKSKADTKKEARKKAFERLIKADSFLTRRIAKVDKILADEDTMLKKRGK